MGVGQVFWWIFLAIVVFLILSRYQASTAVLDTAGGRFIETLGVLQGRDVTTGAGTKIGGIAGGSG